MELLTIGLRVQIKLDAKSDQLDGWEELRGQVGTVIDFDKYGNAKIDFEDKIFGYWWVSYLAMEEYSPISTQEKVIQKIRVLEKRSKKCGK